MWALATGAAIAIYTVIDGLGVRASQDAFRYALTLFALQSSVWLLGVVARQARGWWPGTRRALIGMSGGVLSMVGYIAVLWSHSRSPRCRQCASRDRGALGGVDWRARLSRGSTPSRSYPGRARRCRDCVVEPQLKASSSREGPDKTDVRPDQGIPEKVVPGWKEAFVAPWESTCCSPSSRSSTRKSRCTC